MPVILDGKAPSTGLDWQFLNAFAHQGHKYVSKCGFVGGFVQRPDSELGKGSFERWIRLTRRKDDVEQGVKFGNALAKLLTKCGIHLFVIDEGAVVFDALPNC